MLKRLNFSFEFFKKDSILPFYNHIYNKTNDKIIVNNDVDNSEKHISDIFVVNYIPQYFDLRLDINKSPFSFYKISTYLGFRADFDGFNNVDEYMKSRSRNGIKKILRNHKRLEKCFNITYEMYYGSITKEKYVSLFDCLESMIIKRFEQRNEDHDGLKKWALYKSSSYQMILDKKASLFVISDGEKPIVIGLGFHCQNIFDSAVTSYDIDYAKYGLGNIAVLKKMEWCFDNGYDIYDMGWGELPYKRLWCNAIEPYECHILYKRNKIEKRIIAYAIVLIMNIKTILRKKKILPLKFKINSILKKKTKRQRSNKSAAPEVKLVDLTESISLSKCTEVDLESEEYSFLRKIKFDYQYINSEHTDNLSILKLFDDDNSYIISGKKKTQQIVLQD